MQRASQLFVFEHIATGAPSVERVWRTRSEPADSFMSVAAVHWEMVVTKQNGRAYVTVRGPETRATPSAIPKDAEFFGIQFKLGTFMPGLPLDRLADSAVTLPQATGRSFWLNGSAWEFPDQDNADVFVARLVRKGLLVRDQVVEATLQGQLAGRSPRSVQRRFLRSTGLTYAGLRQIRRALKAVELLENGVSILNTVQQSQYADQPHLTRALRRYVGQTPAQIIRESRSG
jgi:AraC-like DNA-binding protein